MNLNKVKIEKKIPIPVKNKEKLISWYKKTYPFTKMRLGDSFRFSKRLNTTALNAVYEPKCFITRKDGKAFRYWRIS